MARFRSHGHTSGFDVLEARLNALGPQVATKLGQSATRAAMKKVAEPALKSAAPVGPRQDGQKVGKRTHAKIKTSIKVKKGRSREQNAVTVIVTTGRAFHAIFQEKGTVNIPAQPFAEDAIERVTQNIIDVLGVELGKGIDRHVRRNP